MIHLVEADHPRMKFLKKNLINNYELRIFDSIPNY